MKKICSYVLLVAMMSLFLTGCGTKKTVNNQTQAPNEETTTMEEVTQKETEETTKEEPTLSTDIEEWETAKVSGSLAAYEKYFNLNVKTYTSVCEKAGKVHEITYYSEIMGAKRQARVYLPYNYDETQTYPVIYLIHGIGCDSGQWVSMGVNRMFDNMIDKGELKPFIAVFPGVIPADGLDKVSLSETNIQAFVDFVQEFEKDLHPYILKNYAVSEKREDTAICGLSMGGMEALRVGFTYLNRFNYIGSFSAAPTLETDLLTTEGSEYVPELVLLCTGDKDGTVGENPSNYHKILQNNNVDHIWYMHPGQGHSDAVWKLGLLNFLKRLTGGFVN